MPCAFGFFAVFVKLYLSTLASLTVSAAVALCVSDHFRLNTRIIIADFAVLEWIGTNSFIMCSPFAVRTLNQPLPTAKGGKVTGRKARKV